MYDRVYHACVAALLDQLYFSGLESLKRCHLNLPQASSFLSYFPILSFSLSYSLRCYLQQSRYLLYSHRQSRDAQSRRRHPKRNALLLEQLQCHLGVSFSSKAVMILYNFHSRRNCGIGAHLTKGCRIRVTVDFAKTAALAMPAGVVSRADLHGLHGEVNRELGIGQC